MTKKKVPIQLIKPQDCKVGMWVHNTTSDCALHGFWHVCIGVRVGENDVCIWTEMDEFEKTELFHVELGDTIIVAADDPRVWDE